MKNQNWYDEVPFAITVCDEKGMILEMNDKSTVTFAKDGGSELVGKSLLDCHPAKARQKILEMIKGEQVNLYTIEKNGKKKMIYQCPWYESGKMAGLVELSFEIPGDIPHFIRG